MDYQAPPPMEYRVATPQTLTEALVQGYTESCMWLLEGAASPKAAAALEPIVRDYLAQKFGAALLRATSSEEVRRLEDLYYKITGKKVGQL